MICLHYVSLTNYLYQRMTFKLIPFSLCWSRLLLLLMMWVLVKMNFPGHRVMAFLGTHQKSPVTCFLGESTTTARRRLKLMVNGCFQQHQASFSASHALLHQSPPRTFHTISTTRLFAYPQQSRSNHNDDSVPKDIYIPEDQLNFSFVRSSVSMSILAHVCALIGIY